MNAATTTNPQSSSVSTTPGFWGGLYTGAANGVFRQSGISFVVLLIISSVIYGYQPQVGASAESLVAFYTGDRTRILIAAVISGLAVLNLMWFAAALRRTLADAGLDGWGAAATASSAAVAGLFFLIISLGAGLAYSIVASGNEPLTSALNDLTWALVVLSSFPRAMLVMAGTFGLFRAGLISNALFGFGVGAVVLGVLGGTTWLSGGFWAPDGVYSRFVWPVIFLLYVVVASRVLSTRGSATKASS